MVTIIKLIAQLIILVEYRSECDAGENIDYENNML
jgi:hypothetical protein